MRRPNKFFEELRFGFVIVDSEKRGRGYKMKEKLMMFVKQETVLVIAILLAVFSGFFVAPSKEYLSYIDWRVLGILLSLMIIMSGLQKTGLFDSIGSRLLKKTRNTRQLSLMLVFLCFFFSMLITNDVALFTFVPFAMII